MGTITGTMSYQGTRNNKKIVKEIRTKIKNLGHGIRVEGHSIGKRNENRKTLSMQY